MARKTPKDESAEGGTTDELVTMARGLAEIAVVNAAWGGSAGTTRTIPSNVRLISDRTSWSDWLPSHATGVRF